MSFKIMDTNKSENRLHRSEAISYIRFSYSVNSDYSIDRAVLVISKKLAEEIGLYDKEVHKVSIGFDPNTNFVGVVFPGFSNNKLYTCRTTDKKGNKVSVPVSIKALTMKHNLTNYLMADYEKITIDREMFDDRIVVGVHLIPKDQ